MHDFLKQVLERMYSLRNARICPTLVLSIFLTMEIVGVVKKKKLIVNLYSNLLLLVRACISCPVASLLADTLRRALFELQ